MPPIRSTGSGPRSTPRTSGLLGGRRDRPEPCGPRKTGLKAPCPELRAGHPAGRPDDGWEHQRRHQVHRRGRWRAAGPGPPWTAAAKTRQCLRRSRLPLTRGAPAAAPAPDQDQSGVAEGSTRVGSRSPTLGDRAHDLLAARQPPPGPPLRPPRRHPRSLPQPRLRDHLLAPTAEPLTLLGPLNGSARASPRTSRSSTPRGSALVADPSGARTSPLAADAS